MSGETDARLIGRLCDIALEAGAEAMRVYAGEIEVERKDDKSR